MDTSTLLIVLLIVVVVAYFIMRSRSSYGTGTPSYRKDTRTGVGESPTYDSPDYSSSGSIGGVEAPPQRSIPQERSVGSSGSTSSRSHDDPNYRSGGSIGGA